jgi:hypothetical protein
MPARLPEVARQGTKAERKTRQGGDLTGFGKRPPSVGSCLLQVNWRNVYVHDITGYFDSAVARGLAHVAVQPGMGILSQRKFGPDPGNSDCAHADPVTIIGHANSLHVQTGRSTETPESITG